MDQAQIDKIITGSRVYIKDAFGEGWGTVNKLDGDEFWIAVDGRGGYGKYSAAAIIHVHEKTAGEQIASLTEQLAQRDAEIQRLREDLNNTVMLLRRASVKLPPCTLVLNINDYLSRKRLQGGILRDAALPAPAATEEGGR